MKKRLLLKAVAVAFVLSTSGTVLAASNQVVDVPAKHWAYAAVTKLVRDGVIQGYDDQTFRGEKSISRYEMAVMVAKAMSNLEKANEADKALIEKLSTEFSGELDSIGSRASELEEKMGHVEAKVDKFSISGIAEPIYQHVKANGRTEDTPFTLNTEFYPKYKVNDNWSLVGTIINEYNLRNGSDDAHNGGTPWYMREAYLNGHIGKVAAKLGRIDSYPVNSVVLGWTVVNGGDFEVEDGKTTYGLTIGKTADHHDPVFSVLENGEEVGKSVSYTNFRVGYAWDDKTNLTAAFYTAKAGEAYKLDYPNRNIWEIAADTKVGPDLKLIGDYAKANLDLENKSYMVGLQYKEVEFGECQPGDFGAWINYIYLGNGSIMPDKYLDRGSKGYSIGFDYGVAENIVFETRYYDQKEIANNNNKKQTIYTKLKFTF
jgi:hypothetical protein